MKIRVLFAVLLALLLCTTAQAKQKRVAVGAEFSVSLEGNPTTGFNWKVGSTPPFIEAIGSEYVSQNTEGRMPVPGSGGMFVFKFRAKEKGVGEIVFEYLRDWEKVPPLEVHKLQVIAE